MCFHASVIEVCTCSDGCADGGRMKMSQVLHHPAEPLASFYNMYRVAVALAQSGHRHSEPRSTHAHIT